MCFPNLGNADIDSLVRFPRGSSSSRRAARHLILAHDGTVGAIVLRKLVVVVRRQIPVGKHPRGRRTQINDRNVVRQSQSGPFRLSQQSTAMRQMSRAGRDRGRGRGQFMRIVI